MEGKEVVNSAELEEETEDTVSIQEYLKDVEEQELEADLVLGGDEGRECTYSKGYMKRQAIFSCLTCTPDGNAGICTACSLSCHDGHEILELWTKRNFRCDCGNSKFGEFFCKLCSNKDVENIENCYNHNFKGVYCTCNRPYPDPDVEEQEEMVQCCICEDWFHEVHLGLESLDEIPKTEEGEALYDELICQNCSTNFSFLTLYPQSVWATSRENTAATAKEKGVLAEEVESGAESSRKVEDGIGSSNHDKDGNESSSVESLSGHKSSDLVNQVTVKDTVLQEFNEDAFSSVGCLLGTGIRANSLNSGRSKSMFLSRNWRDALCHCVSCLNYYSQKHISFILDKEDSIAEYEKIAKQKREEHQQQQAGIEQKFLDKLGHVQKIEILSGIADMKNEISSFLASQDQSKPITSDDIHEVFKNLAKKRRRDM